MIFVKLDYVFSFFIFPKMNATKIQNKINSIFAKSNYNENNIADYDAVLTKIYYIKPYTNDMYCLQIPLPPSKKSHYIKRKIDITDPTCVKYVHKYIDQESKPHYRYNPNTYHKWEYLVDYALQNMDKNKNPYVTVKFI